jgi:hypothetical protein
MIERVLPPPVDHSVGCIFGWAINRRERLTPRSSRGSAGLAQ